MAECEVNGLVALLWRLCVMECCGVSYLYPLADGQSGRLVRTFLRPPLSMDKYRETPLRARNGRRQR